MKKIAIFLSSILLMMSAAHAQDEPSALVTVMPLQEKMLAKTITLYGTWEADPTQTSMISLPVSGQLQKTFVSEGDFVKKETPLFDFILDPNAQLSYQQAQLTLASSKDALKRTERLFQQQLATRSQLLDAQKNVLDAEASLNSFQGVKTASGKQVMTAPFNSVVMQFLANPGDHLQAGAPLLKLANCHALAAHLGAAPEDAALMKSGMKATIFALSASNTIDNLKVLRVGHQLNPATHLVDVWVGWSNCANTSLSLGAPISGNIQLSEIKSIAVPLSAILKENQAMAIYQVQQDHAIKVPVTITVQDGNWVGIEGAIDIKNPVVTVGNYELQDGMKVRVASP